mgnify:CR=1 FL=1
MRALIAQIAVHDRDQRGGPGYAALTGKPTTAKIGTKFTIITQGQPESSPQSQAAIYKTSLLIQPS